MVVVVVVVVGGGVDEGLVIHGRRGSCGAWGGASG